MREVAGCCAACRAERTRVREAWRAARWLTLTLLGLAACSGGGDAEEAEARPAEHALEGRLAGAGSWSEERLREELVACLLYTSDAADE